MCNDVSVLRVILLVKLVMNIIKIAVPIILIIMGMLDMTKAVFASSDDAIAKSKHDFVTRIIAAVMVFLVPTIVDFAINGFGKFDVNYMQCWDVATRENIRKIEAENEKMLKARLEAERARKEESKNNSSIGGGSSSSPLDQKRLEIVNYALKFSPSGSKITSSSQYKTGHPYVWGGTKLCDDWKNSRGCGVDCSSFVQTIYKKYGYKIPRVSRDQAVYKNGTKITDFGTNYSNLKLADLIFYEKNGRVYHVAMYIGDGKIVHAWGKNYGVVTKKINYSNPAWAVRVIN